MVFFAHTTNSFTTILASRLQEDVGIVFLLISHLKRELRVILMNLAGQLDSLF